MKLLEQHKVGAVVVTCIDFRFHPQLPSALARDLGVEAYDLISLAGGAGNLALFGSQDVARRKVALGDIRTAVALHGASRVVLLNHQQCGKYAAAGREFPDLASERSYHTGELTTAARLAREQFPEVEVIPGFIRVDEKEQVIIERVAG